MRLELRNRLRCRVHVAAAVMVAVAASPIASGQAAQRPNPVSPSLLGTAVVEVNLDDVDLYVDGQRVRSLSSGEPLVLEGMPTGLHEFMGVRRGYEPDTKEVLIAPGQRVTVTLRIRYPRRINEAARDLVERGERLLFSRRWTVNPLNVLPVRRSQSRYDLERARDLFVAALQEDPDYGRPARLLGQVHQLLGNRPESLAAYRSALRIDPSDVDATLQFAAVLLESGDPRGAYRQLINARNLEEPTDELYAMLARVFWDQRAWEQSVEVARQAIELNASNAQAHLFKADALRYVADEETSPILKQSLFRESREGYLRFLSLTNFESLDERLGFHFIGFGISRRHADSELVWRDLRATGYLGLCITEHRTHNPLRAQDYCQRAIRYDEHKPIPHFLLGNINRDLFNLYGTCDYLTSAARSYSRMIEINPNLAESDDARFHLEQITGIARQLGCPEPAAAYDPGLRVVVLDGDDSVNIIEQGTAVPAVVEVPDDGGGR